MMRQSSRGLVSLGVLGLVIACTSTQPYPEDWAQLQPSQKGQCADIAGAYHNACTPTSGYHNCLPSGGLAALMFRKYPSAFHRKLANVNRVTIEQPSPRQLIVKAWQGSDLVNLEEIELSTQDCTPDGILISGGSTLANIENAFGYGSSRAYFRKDESGNLVARVHEHFTGIVLLIPASVSAKTWFRFKAHANPDVEVPADAERVPNDSAAASDDPPLRGRIERSRSSRLRLADREERRYPDQ